MQVIPSTRSEGGAGAVYTAALNKITVTGVLNLTGSVLDQSTIIHEVTHALMDFHHYHASDLVQEVAAYLAEGLYARARATRLRAGNPAAQAILDAAQGVVGPRGMVGRPGTRVSISNEDVMALAEAIRGSDIYPNPDTVHRSDGISGGLINPWYQPRHHGSGRASTRRQ